MGNRATRDTSQSLMDDVRYLEKNGLSADVEFPAEFDPKRTRRMRPDECILQRALFRLPACLLNGLSV